MLGLVEYCDDCGFVYEQVAPAEVPAILRALGAQYADVLLRPEAQPILTARPAAGVWSALEYACHVRDVLLVQRDRVLLALVEDTPSLARMHGDERVAVAGYQRQGAADVAAQLQMAADLMATLFEGLSSQHLDRRCIYNFPESTEHDVRWLGRHTVHEVTHHLGDVRAVINGAVPR
jgi:hypothetical protein